MKPAIGGQAVLEGVMLRSPKKQALAVRTPDGEITTEVQTLAPLSSKRPWLGLPLIRGVVAIFESLSAAISTLGRSAQIIEPEEEFTSRQLTAVAVLAMVLGIGLFFLLPAVVVNPLNRWFNPSPLLLNIAEGAVRILIFIGYLVVISLSKDIKTTFQYHGAEHKVIDCWEQDKPLTPESAATCSRLHPRCGTSFLLLVVVASILLFSFFSPANLAHKLLLRLALLPVLAGIAYELTRWTAKSKSPVAAMVLAPGLALQRLTTREPEVQHLEVALAALGLLVDQSDQ